MINLFKLFLCALSLSHVWIFVTPWAVACQAPLSMGILQARILEWVAIPFSRSSSQPRNRTRVSCIAIGFFTSWATSSFQSLNRVRLFATPWITACQASLSITNSWSSPKLMHWVGDAIQPSHPLSSPSPLALNVSQHQGLFTWVGSSHQVTKVLELQLHHQSFQWIDLGTLKSLL